MKFSELFETIYGSQLDDRLNLGIALVVSLTNREITAKTATSGRKRFLHATGKQWVGGQADILGDRSLGGVSQMRAEFLPKLKEPTGDDYLKIELVLIEIAAKTTPHKSGDSSTRQAKQLRTRLPQPLRCSMKQACQTISLA
ncbi:hypothetical protein HJFPF1_12218 [Paramyrothecium foliicola]|nr:hypothetical protein HJFPF1_12218 [Paramyrothecium foliicola]